MAELQEKITKLNAKAKELNSLRQKNIGRREALLKQQEDAINAYNKKYGTSITAETIKEEYARVSSQKEDEANQLESIIEAIGRGDYETANKLAGVEVNQGESAKANDEYVEKAVESVGVSSVEVPDTKEQSVVDTTEQSFGASDVNGQSMGVSGTKEQAFTPSPIGNPLDMDTGKVSGLPKDSVFTKNFSDEAEDNIAPPPVAPPFMGGFGAGNKGALPKAPVAPLSSLL